MRSNMMGNAPPLQPHQRGSRPNDYGSRSDEIQSKYLTLTIDLALLALKH